MEPALNVSIWPSFSIAVKPSSAHLILPLTCLHSKATHLTGSTIALHLSTLADQNWVGQTF